ncbi:MAG: DEAD/DEAH box helicase, partial [Micrococcales bacterium]|nr:DEAD/DEAH box helicase [Micrococcales bacterium]
MTTDTRADGLAILRGLTGKPDAVFHDGQWEAIEALVVQQRRALVVERTGWGKSAVYFIASLLRRRQGFGPALIVSPLLALMRDQVAAAGRAGVRAVTINSANVTEWKDVEDRLTADTVDVLLISPERLVNPSFRKNRLPRLIHSAGLVVIDEAHCISDWGHDFRPDYRRIRDLLADLPPQTPVLATTATANSRVVADVEEQIAVGGHDVLTVRGSLARPSLRLGVLRLPDPSQRLAWLAEHLGDLPGSGIIYCLTVAAATDTASFLAGAGHNVLAYTGRSDDAERQSAEAALKANQVKALAATSALGMGFDKPDLGFIVHLGAPSSPVAYYQQVGRAGRATPNADVLLMPSPEDQFIWDYFATSSMPTPAVAQQTLQALADSPGPISVPALESRVDIKRTRLELLLKVLAVDDAVERADGGWRLTGKPWHYDQARYERVAAARRAEQQAMLRYENLTTCRMEFLTSQLDDPNSAACGRCDVCAGVWYPTAVSAEGTRSAQHALAQVGVPIEPRSAWPKDLDRLGVIDNGAPPTGRIPADERPDDGRAVARLTDLGWGARLRDLFRTDQDGQPIDSVLPDELAKACCAALRDWPWRTRPVAVAWIPSLSRPQLVESLARSIIQTGRLENLGPLELAPAASRQPRSFNSAYRVRDVWGRFRVPAAM